METVTDNFTHDTFVITDHLAIGDSFLLDDKIVTCTLVPNPGGGNLGKAYRHVDSVVVDVPLSTNVRPAIVAVTFSNP